MVVKPPKIPVPNMSGMSFVISGNVRQQVKPEITVVEKHEFTHNDKQKLKHKLKAGVKKKFIIGQKYVLRTKSKEGSEIISKVFILKKFIYSIEDRPINILILKQIDGYVSNMHTINVDDCKMLHIKYEPGLQVWSMDLNWKLVKEKKS